MIYIAICDDHKAQVENIKKCIQKLNLNKEVELCTFTNEEEMIQMCTKINRNFIFILDIVLQDNVSGIDIAKKINELFPKSVIIFISSYLEKVTDIFEVEQCYFIYKPEMEKRLQDALEKAISIYDHRSRTLSFRVGS
ncbi:MAG: LytR/AlgR family response regulator transcription factor, partial [Floccifex sp.]